MNFIIALGLSLSLLLASLLLTKKKRYNYDIFLAGYLVYASINFFYFYLETTDALLYSPVLYLLGKGFILLEGPLFYFYLHSFLIKKTKSKRWYFLNLLPFFMFSLFLVYFSIIEKDTIIEVQNDLFYFDGKISTVWAFLRILMGFLYPIYLFLYGKLIYNSKRNLKKNVSTLDQLNIEWLINVLHIWVITTVLQYISYYVYNNFEPMNQYHFNLISYSLYALSIFLLGFFGLKYTTHFADLVPTDIIETKKASYKKSGLKKDVSEKIYFDLMEFMKSKKPYLNENLTLSKLANELNVSANHLSQVINENEEKNFYDFVNHYRVNEIITKLEDSYFSNYTLLAIAYESGFKSKASFNKCFKRITGCTPSEYKKKLN